MKELFMNNAPSISKDLAHPFSFLLQVFTVNLDGVFSAVLHLMNLFTVMLFQIFQSPLISLGNDSLELLGTLLPVLLFLPSTSGTQVVSQHFLGFAVQT